MGNESIKSTAVPDTTATPRPMSKAYRLKLEQQLEGYFCAAGAESGVSSNFLPLVSMAMSGGPGKGGGADRPDRAIARLHAIHRTIGYHARTRAVIQALSPRHTDVLFLAFGPHGWPSSTAHDRFHPAAPSEDDDGDEQTTKGWRKVESAGDRERRTRKQTKIFGDVSKAREHLGDHPAVCLVTDAAATVCPEKGGGDESRMTQIRRGLFAMAVAGKDDELEPVLAEARQLLDDALRAFDAARGPREAKRRKSPARKAGGFAAAIGVGS